MHNVRRRQEASRVRENRIITEYVQIKHPGIYKNAKALYTRLDNLYPEKKDLRRTYEYQAFMTGLEPKKYKYSRQQHRAINDNMLLQIELMDNPADVPAVPAVVPADVPAVVPPVVPADVPAVPPVVSADVPAVSAIPDVTIEDAEITLPAVSDEIVDEIIRGLRHVVPADVPAVSAIPDVTIEDAEITLPAVSDEIVDEIIRELRQDPDLNSIFDNIDIEDERELLLW